MGAVGLAAQMAVRAVRAVEAAQTHLLAELVERVPHTGTMAATAIRVRAQALAVAVVAQGPLAAMLMAHHKSLGMAATGPRVTGSRQRHRLTLVVVVHRRGTRLAVAATVGLEAAAMAWTGRPMALTLFPTLAAAVVAQQAMVSVAQGRLVTAQRALSSSDTRWPHNG